MIEAKSSPVPSSSSHLGYGVRILLANISPKARGINCDIGEGTSTEKPSHGECQQDNLPAQVEGLLAEVVSSQGCGQPYQGDPDTRPRCWGCGKRGRNCWNLDQNWSRDVQMQGNSKTPLN